MNHQKFYVTSLKAFSQNAHTSFIVLCLFFFSLSSCRKDRNEGNIPYVAVNISLPLSLPQYMPLNSVGNSIEISGGYKGIIIYHRFQNEFVAYERACPYDPLQSSAIVEIDTDNVTGIDSNCGSKFLLTDGSILNGPANKGLKQYQTEYDPGSQVLLIYN